MSFNYFRSTKLILSNFIKSVLIKIRLKIFMCFLLRTYFSIFLQDDFIRCNVNSRTIIFLPVKFLSLYGMVTVVLGRSTFKILRTKVSQDLEFFWWIPGAIYETGFGITLRVVYIYFSGLERALTHLGLSIWWGKFSSLLTTVTSTFFIGSFYYNFICRLHNFHAFKNINQFPKSNRLTVKNLQICLLDPDIGHTT